MLSIRLLALPILFSASAALSAACTGTCTTIEYRKDEDYDATDVTYERDGSGYAYIAFASTSSATNDPPSVYGTPYPEETAIVQALIAAAESARATARAHVNSRWEEITSDAGTTNNCSTGCECAEGEFTEQPDSLVLSPGIHEIGSFEHNGQIFSYFSSYAGSATIEYTKRTKTVDCVALEP